MSKKRTSRDKRITLVAMLMAAEQGDETILPVLRKRFDEEPDLWEQAGNIALQAERSMIRFAAGKNALSHEAMERKADQLRAELVGPAPTALERLLVDQIIICWLQVSDAARSYANRARGGITLHEFNYLQSSQDRSQRRYLQAIRTLAQVRRLLAPTVQVNIAKQQVNVAR